MGLLLFATAIYRVWDHPAFKEILENRIQVLSKSIALGDKTPSKTIRLKISGMICISCEQKIKNALMKLQGVKKVDLTYSQEAATIIVNPQRLSADALIETVVKTGYQATEIVE